MILCRVCVLRLSLADYDGTAVSLVRLIVLTNLSFLLSPPFAHS